MSLKRLAQLYSKLPKLSKPPVMGELTAKPGCAHSVNTTQWKKCLSHHAQKDMEEPKCIFLGGGVCLKGLCNVRLQLHNIPEGD